MDLSRVGENETSGKATAKPLHKMRWKSPIWVYFWRGKFIYWFFDVVVWHVGEWRFKGFFGNLMIECGTYLLDSLCSKRNGNKFPTN